MTVLYQKIWYNEVCYIATAVYYQSVAKSSMHGLSWSLLPGLIWSLMPGLIWSFHPN